MTDIITMCRNDKNLNQISATQAGNDEQLVSCIIDV